jgi:hypothetical protein
MIQNDNWIEMIPLAVFASVSDSKGIQQCHKSAQDERA